MEKYPLYYNGKVIGNVLLYPQGQFYDLGCRFAVKAEGPLHLYVECGETAIDLGLCVPYGEEMGIKRCFAKNKLGTGERQFYIQGPLPDSCFEPLHGDRPFLRMTELMQGRFEMRLGAPGILFDRD